MLNFVLPDDDYVENNTIWIAVLSNGETVYQDDRIDFLMWQSLKRHVEDNQLAVADMKFKFRSHVVHLPKPRKCVVFSRAAGRWSTSQTTDYYYIYGVDCEAEIHRDWYIVPSLIPMESDIKVASQLPEKTIIWNRG